MTTDRKPNGIEKFVIELASIVAELADINPDIYPDDAELGGTELSCLFCTHSAHDDGPHDPSCLWRRAKTIGQRLIDGSL